MARIAYVDHSFHSTTKSTDFLPEILRRHGHLVDYHWDKAWQGGAPTDWAQVADYDVVIMFQSFCPIGHNHFRRLHPNVVYIPMLDQFGFWQGPLFNLSSFWEPFQGSKVLNFSNAVHCMCTGFGIASHLVRYYQPGRAYLPPPADGLHGFFWLRRELQLPWATIRRLIAGSRFDSLHLHLAVDPGTPAPRLPSEEDIERHRITTSAWFENKADLNAIIERSNVYFAPRMEEGIGQSFLEALARGQCVVAPNQGTMNEYILPGVNGLLYDAAAPSPLDFSDVAMLGARARETTQRGRAVWEQGEEALVRFILAPSAGYYLNKYQHPALLRPPAAPEPAASPVHAAEASTTALGRMLARLAKYSKRNALLRKTRVAWLPLKRLLFRAMGR